MKKIICIVLCLFCLVSVFAKREKNSRDVENPDSWKESFELKNRKSGKHNIVVTATDIGGNETLAGPMNIFIDPDSDLPVSNITNPSEDMRIIGNLNIVGTCVDDDGVEGVYLILDGDKDNIIKAEGKEFWSYYLDTTNLAEGPHTIEVYGIDDKGLDEDGEKIKGVKGKSKKVTWQLDRRAPSTDVQSHRMGMLVSGKQTIKGLVTDGNGISSLAFSTDGGNSFVPVKLKKAKKSPDCTFEFVLDTFALSDGAQVSWFKAVDSCGTVGYYSFLFFVDNTKPDIQIIYPTEATVVNGKFCVAGFAKDVIGMRSLNWHCGNQSGEIELIPGNPFFSVEVDARKVSSSIEFKMSGKDTAGNESSISKKFLINNTLDMPVVEIASPAIHSMVEETIFLNGIARDDDGIAAVYYQLDSEEAVELESDGAFMCEIPAPGFGSHTLKVWAKDIHDVEGIRSTVVFEAPGPKPEISDLTIVSGNQSAACKAGALVNPDAHTIIKGAVKSGCGIKSFTWQFSGKPEEAANLATPTKGNFEINIPVVDTRWGYVELVINATDIYDRNTTFKLPLYVENLAKVQGNTGVYIPDGFADEDGFVQVQFDENFKSISGYFAGGEIASVKLIPDSPYAKVEAFGSSFVITSTGRETGADPNAYVNVQVISKTGAAYTSDKKLKFSYADDGLLFNHASIGSVNAEPYISGMVVSADKGVPSNLVFDVYSLLPVKDIAVTANGKVLKTTMHKNDGSSMLYQADCVIQDFPAGLVDFDITANVNGGDPVKGKATLSFVRTKDPSEIEDANTVYFVQTVDANGYYLIDSTMQGYDTVKAFANFNAPFQKVAFVNPVEGLSLSAEDKVVSIASETEGEYRNVAIIITDADGIEHRSNSINIRVDNKGPDISWTIPEKQVWVQNSVKIAGTITEAVGLQRAVYSTDNGESWQNLNLTKKSASESTFETSIDLTDREDGLVTIMLSAEDNSGKITKLQKVCNKDTVAPEITVILPEAESTVNGETLLVMSVNENGRIDSANYTFGVKKNEIEIKSLASLLVGSEEAPLDKDMPFVFTDAAGNSTKIDSWNFNVDSESDLPVAEIHVPGLVLDSEGTEIGEVITTDFVISGVVYDDDGIQLDETGSSIIAGPKIWYKIDDGEYKTIEELGSSYSINVPLSSMTDNEHTVTVYAEDIRGVKGREVVRKFRISLEEPKGAFESPSVEETVKDVVTLHGVASDRNGIDRVDISIDNGNTWMQAHGTTEWTYTFDTHIIEDGTHVIFMKVWDAYGIEGLYSSLLNVDNTAPKLSLELPKDDTRTSEMIFFSGETRDNIGLQKLYISIRNLDKTAQVVPQNLARIDLDVDDIITKSVSLATLPEGFYNVEVTGEDAGGNISRVSRNIQLDRALSKARVDILYPLNNEVLNSRFNIYGKVTSEQKVESITLFVDGNETASAELSEAGYYKFPVDSELMEEGRHKYFVRVGLENGEVVQTGENLVTFNQAGPWVTVDSLSLGDFAVNRPWLKGKAGYVLSEEDKELYSSKNVTKLEKTEIKNKSLAVTEISFDNGKTFTVLGDEKEWEYRIENQDLREGYHFIIVRATMKNGEKATTRMILQIDKTAPVIRLISPEEGGRYNEELIFSGLASDDISLKNVNLSLRTGDKSSYEVPQFIQGLYLDAQFWGATLWSVGAGLSFFDDHVNIQFNYGQFTESQWSWVLGLLGKPDQPIRYGGHVFGAKILANVFYLPFSYFAGPDWNWLSLRLSLGADFSLFTKTQNGNPQMLSALLANLEFPIFTSHSRHFLSSFSFYTEYQLWLTGTDVDTSSLTNNFKVGAVTQHLTAGIRLYIF